MSKNNNYCKHALKILTLTINYYAATDEQCTIMNLKRCKNISFLNNDENL